MFIRRSSSALARAPAIPPISANVFSERLFSCSTVVSTWNWRLRRTTKVGRTKTTHVLKLSALAYLCHYISAYIATTSGRNGRFLHSSYTAQLFTSLNLLKINSDWPRAVIKGANKNETNFTNRQQVSFPSIRRNERWRWRWCRACSWIVVVGVINITTEGSYVAYH